MFLQFDGPLKIETRQKKDEGDTMAMWSELPTDILCNIAQSLPTLIDLVRLSAVCRSWQDVALQEKWYNFPRPSPIPWLMLAEEPDSDTRRFFHPTTGEAFEVPLPEARGRNCCGSTDGWLVTMGEDLEVHLLNPLSREQFLLPHYSTFKDEDGENDLSKTTTLRLMQSFEKVVLSCRPGDGDCLVLANVNVGGADRLFFARPGDGAWKLVHQPPNNPALDLIYFKDKFYVMGCTGMVQIFDVGEEDIKFSKIISPELPYETRNWYPYLLNVGDELVGIARLVQRVESESDDCDSHTSGDFDLEESDDSEPDYHSETSDDESIYRTQGFRLFKLGSHTSDSDWTEIYDLGDYCLFIGKSTSMCLTPVPDGCRKNSIYFTDDFTEAYLGGFNEVGGRDMGVFSLDDGSIMPHYEGESLSLFSPPLWVTLNSSLMWLPPWSCRELNMHVTRSEV